MLFNELQIKIEDKIRQKLLKENPKISGEKLGIKTYIELEKIFNELAENIVNKRMV